MTKPEVMGELVRLPGVTEVPSVEDDFDLDAVLDRQADLLARWKVFGEEIKRRAEHPLPIDLALELYDLLNEIDA